MAGVEVLGKSPVRPTLPKLFHKVERVDIVQVKLAADQMDFAIGSENAIVLVANFASKFGDLFNGCLGDQLVAEHQQCGL